MIKIRRNDKCPCGSGKKYKKCCYLDPDKNAEILRATSIAKDYGDELVHKVTVEKICEMTSKETGFPKLVNKKGIAPPQYGEGISGETN